MASLVDIAFSQTALRFLETLQPKLRRQIIKKCKSLCLEPHPPGSKKLVNVTDNDGSPVYRERSGDYRILYILRQNPHAAVVILDIDNRKDVYR